MFQILSNSIFKSLSALRLGVMMCLTFASIVLSAQSKGTETDSVTQKFSITAARLCQEKKFDAALHEIEKAIQDKEECREVYTWYTRGFIYKEIFKSEVDQDQRNYNREIAVESFLKARSLNGSATNANNDAALKYLAATYMNDALITVSDLNSNVSDADRLFVRYQDLMDILSLSGNFAQENLKYTQAKGQRFLQAMSFSPCDPTIAESAEKSILESIRLDSTDCNQRYNLAVVYYRMGFEIETNECMERSEENVLRYQSLALSTLLDAEIRCDQNMEIKSALLNVYRFLKDELNVLKYEEKLNSLIIQNQKNHK